MSIKGNSTDAQALLHVPHLESNASPVSNNSDVACFFLRPGYI